MFFNIQNFLIGTQSIAKKRKKCSSFWDKKTEPSQREDCKTRGKQEHAQLGLSETIFWFDSYYCGFLRVFPGNLFSYSLDAIMFEETQNSGKTNPLKNKY